MDHSKNTNVEFYKEHAGTLKISGSTVPKAAAICAFGHLQAGMQVIDFFYIGGNAGLQAVKAMTLFAHKVLSDSKGKIGIAFFPAMYMTITTDPHTGDHHEKTATVWRSIIFDVESQNLPVKFSENHTLIIGNHEDHSRITDGGHSING